MGKRGRFVNLNRFKFGKAIKRASKLRDDKRTTKAMTPRGR